MPKITPEIASFRGPYAFLSNFSDSTIRYEGVLYPTVEHAYQCAKTLSQVERDRVCFVFAADGKPIRRTTPGEAKRAGRQVTLRADWDAVRIDVMRQLLVEKFSSVRQAEALIATGDAELIEGNNWGDTFWGRCNGRGENWLGKLLMEIREAVR